MAKKLKLHYEGAVYHVLLRGNYCQSVFVDKADYRYFYHLLDRAVENYDCKIHCFSLMPNQIHLLIEVGSMPLSQVMQLISNCHTRHMNKKLDRIGHLFQGRYKSKIIQHDGYVLELCRYIYLNAQTGASTSHACYLGEKDLSWLGKGFILERLKKNFGEQFTYQNFVELCDQSEGEPYQFLNFAEGEIEVGDMVKKKFCKRNSISINHLSMSDITKVICGVLGVPQEGLALRNACEKTDLAKLMVAYFSHYYAAYELSEVGKFLQQNPNVLSESMRGYFDGVLGGGAKSEWTIKIEKALLLTALE